MTRLNLAQTCLLEVSGELGKKAQAQLKEHVRKYPTALVEYELIRGQFELLRGMPAELPEEMSRQVAAKIKQGIHQRLREQENARRSQRRWKLIYHAMAGVTGVAAGLAIAVGVYIVMQGANEQRTTAVARAEQSLRSYLTADAENRTDIAYGLVNLQIQSAEEQQRRFVTKEAPRAALRLLDELDVVDAEGTPEPQPEPF